MNLGFSDRIIRVVVGLSMVLFDYAADVNWDVILLFIGCWSVLTSAFGFCPFYKILGHSTCPI